MRALLVGLAALCVVALASAATNGGASAQPTGTTAKIAEKRPLTLDQQLKRKLAALRKYRGAVRFFENRRTLLAVGSAQPDHSAKLAYAKRRVRQLTRTVAYLRNKIRARDQRRLAALPPRKAICEVFGASCSEAVAVAWCESRLETTARNGQYLGLFQMGSYERELFGHGDTAHAQAEAAHRYFVESGRDWSPWTCRWAA